jgi:hypothetical protein
MAEKKQQPTSKKPDTPRIVQRPPDAKIREWKIVPTKVGKGREEIVFHGSKSQARKKAQQIFEVGAYRLLE